MTEYLREINSFSVMFRLCLAAMLGGLIGFERGSKRRPAGLRTHVLVCVGAALAMSTNQYAAEILGSSTDVMRLGAQVISGIGFLGAGTILVTNKQQVKGLTTAAGLWASACMGLSVGIGFYEGAFFGCFFIWCSMTLLHKIDKYMRTKSKVLDLYVELKSVKGIGILMDYLKSNHMEISCVEVVKIEEMKRTGVFMTMKMAERKEHAEIIGMISSVETVTFVEEL